MSVEIPTINIKIEQLEEDEKLEVGNICKLLKKISDSKHAKIGAETLPKFRKIDFDFGKSTKSLIKGISGKTKSVYSK